MGRLGIVVQARMGSSRLPGKVLADLAGAPALIRLFERLRRVKRSPKIVLATSTLPGDDPIAALVATQPDIALWRGPERDVLRRYADAARHFDIGPVVRITADCPLMEPSCIDEVLNAFHSAPNYEYADNLVPRTYPHGYDVQVVSRAALETSDREAVDPYEREHVLPFIQRREDRFRTVHVSSADYNNTSIRITLDFPEDLVLIRAIYERLYPDNPHFGLNDILRLRDELPTLFDVNKARRIY
jgi:spore coat polysaccharide biosynthesis protein SpsF